MEFKESLSQNFKQTYRDFVLSSQFVVVFLLTLTQSVIIGFFQVFSKTETYNDSQNARVAVLSLLVTILFGALTKVYCYFHMGKKLNLICDTDKVSLTKRVFLDWIITEVIVQIRVFIGIILFIIPGLIEALRLSLAVPYVFFDKRMKDKTFNPIYESRKELHLKNPELLRLFLLIIVAPILLFLAFQNGNTSFFENQMSMARAGLSALAFSLFTSYNFLYLAFLYKDTTSKIINKTGEI